MWQICRVFITTYCVDCCVYYSLLLVAMVNNEVLFHTCVLKFVILEVGIFHGVKVKVGDIYGSRRVMIVAALLLEMIRYKLA